MAKQATPTLVKSLVASGSITANTFVTAAGATAGAGVNTFGVANSTAASGERFPVTVLGTQTVLSGGQFTAGTAVKSDASGKAIDRGGSGVAAGIALEAATGADQPVEVFLIPNAA